MVNHYSWRSWHSELIALVNGEFRSRKLRVLAEFAPKMAFTKAAHNFVRRTGELSNVDDNDANSVSISISSCVTDAISVKKMKLFLEQYVKDDVYMALLHGSLGTNEVVPYSDFDALVIIKDEVLQDAQRLSRVAQHLFQARRFMYEQDPLQHHGWFVLPEQALQAWPEDYLPVEVLRHSTLLTQSCPMELHLNPTMGNESCEAALLGLLDGVKREITTGSCFLNLYSFKSMISKVLLLPTIYIQVRDGKGVFKRGSFNMAKDDFSASDWAPIDIASTIRCDWPSVSPSFPRQISQRPGLVGGKWRKKRSQPIPSTLRNLFKKSVEDSLLSLIGQMEAVCNPKRRLMHD